MSKLKIFITIAIILLCSSLTYAQRDLTKALTQEEQKINDLAFSAYVKKMKGHVLAEEGTLEIEKMKIHFNIENFASSGDEIYEVKIKYIGSELRAILLINPKNEKVKFLIGPWDEIPKEE